MAEPPDRATLFTDRGLAGRDLVHAYTAAVDDWLAALFVESLGVVDDVALVAVGGYGRAELCPQSDIDVVLLHAGRGDMAEVAERIWYPIWDSGVKLGHAVRTPKEAMTLAADDLDTATSLLSVRRIAGSNELATRLAEDAAALWRKRSKRFLAELGRSVSRRQAESGEVAFLLEPDLKDGRGGMRDVQAIGWAHEAQQVMFEGEDASLAAAYEVVLAARVELHRRTGRSGNVLLLQEQDGVAEGAGYADADSLMAALSSAARTISWTSDEVWDAISRTALAVRGWRSSRDRPVDEHLVLREGRIHVDESAPVASDAALALRAAAAAARLGTRIERASLDRLAAESPPMPDPWPPGAREALVDLLAAGPAAVPVLEGLDQRGLVVRALPEWEHVRSRPQRNAYHRFTVDRHLIEAATGAASLTDRVSRPDLLVLGALFHDLGKGYPGDHTEVGVDLVGRIGPRLGLPPDDVATLAAMVQHHLLLPDVATRRDLSDDRTIRHVADAVGDVETLNLLAALTEADSIATGPAAWGSWKAELVADLTRRTAFVLGGGPVAAVTSETFPTDEHRALMASGERQVIGIDDRLTVVWPDRPGMFSRVAGVLALSALDVLDAAVHSEAGIALETFRVESTIGPTIDWDRVTTDVEEALSGRLAIEARLAERARTYARRTRGADESEPRVIVDNDVSDTSTVVEVHARDRIGVLYRITKAISDVDLDVRSAKVQTLGTQVVDSFYLCGSDGRKVTDSRHLAELERAVLHALAELPSG